MLKLLMCIHLHLLQEKGRARARLKVVKAVPSSGGSVGGHHIGPLQLPDLHIIEGVVGDPHPMLPDLPLAFEPLLIILPGDLPPLGHPLVPGLLPPSDQLRELA